MTSDVMKRTAELQILAKWITVAFKTPQRTLGSFMLLLVLLGAGISSAHAATQYFYDNLGRLDVVLNSDGSLIEYDYDANGNVTRINRVNAPPASVVAVNPTVVHAGSSISVSGTGFDPTPAQNIVTIGGAAASVVSASITSLVVTVPSNAATGPVAVTVNGVTATSSQIVTVLRPTITGFSPAFVNPGAAVTLLGTNFNLVPGSTTIAVGAVPVSVSALSNTQATFTAPTSSGLVAVNTSYGQTQSVTPLNVVPAIFPAANVVALAALETTGTPQSISVGQVNKYGVYQFAAVQGQYLSLHAASLSAVPSSGAINYSVYTPSGSVLVSGSLTTIVRSIHLPVLPTTGNYLIAFYSATATFQLNAFLEVDGSVTAGGSSLSASTTAGAQSKRFIFSANQGEKLGLGVSNLVKTNGNASYAYLSLRLTRPDGSSAVYTCYTSNGGCDANLVVASAGTHTVVMSSVAAAQETNMTMSFMATISNDIEFAATLNAPTNVNLSRVGQNGRVTFAGTAGGAMAIQIGGITTTPTGRSLVLTVSKPDGAILTSLTTAYGNAINLPNLPATGTYLLSIDPQFGATANPIVTIATSSSVAVTIDGASNTVTTTPAPGEYAYFTFNATAGENLGLGISNLVKTNGSPSSLHVFVYVYKPDGSTWTFIQCYPANGGCDLNLSGVPVTGVYSVLVRSASASSEPNMTMSFTATVSRDLVIALPAATPTTVNLSRRGQNGRVTFSGTAGTTISLQIAAITTTPVGRSLFLNVIKPDGTSLATRTTTVPYTFNLTNLPATGTYWLWIDPQYGASATLQVTKP